MIFLVAAAPVVIYMCVIILILNRRAKESLLRLLLCFAFGILSGILALTAEYAWTHFVAAFIRPDYIHVFIDSFIGVSLIEETAKWIWLVFIIRTWSSFDKYSDGILYGACIAGGFALIESALYVVSEIPIAHAITRGITAVPVHFFFGILQGFLFARYHLEADRFLWFSLGVPVLLHGLYDFFILQPYAELLMGAALMVLAGSLALSVWVCISAMRADKIRV